MNSRRLITGPSRLSQGVIACQSSILSPPGCDVRFGSKADMCSAKRHVRFSPNSDIKCDMVECPLWANSGLRMDYAKASDRREFERLPLSGWAMKPKQVCRRVRQRVCDTIHDVSREDSLSGLRIAPQGAFKQLLML